MDRGEASGGLNEWVALMSTPKKTDWWYSVDGKRGFCFGAVKGFDYRPAAGGQMGGTLYLYLDGGMAHYTGAEADTVFALVKGKGKA